MKILRPDQEDVILNLRSSLGRGFKSPMIQCSTGFGKTVLASAIVQGVLRKKKRVIFTVPAISLINQTVESFYADGIYDIGVIQADHEMTNYSMPVQVCSVQTLMNMREIPHADIVIIDEAHEFFKFYGEWMIKWNKIPFVGLSATPWTKGLGKHFDDLILGPTTQELIDMGILCPFTVFGPSAPDLSKVRTVAGDYHEGDLSIVMDQPPLIADVVESWLKHAEYAPTLCFGVDRAHAKHLYEKFEAAGVKSAYIDSYTEVEERDEIKKKLHNGEIHVVCNIGTLTKGIDWDIRCIILARPTKSEILFTQIIGRLLRTAEGKLFGLILDHTSTHEKLGYVTDIYHDKLDDGKVKKAAKKKEKKEKLPAKCPKCTLIKAAGVHICPNCLFAPQKQTNIKEAEGELTQLKGKKKVKKYTAQEKQEFYSSLVKYCQDKKKNDGWKAHTYKEYFGVWPRCLTETPGPMIPQCMAHIKHKQIKWAKRRKTA